MTKFSTVEDVWRERLKMLPNTLRQELVSRQLDSHLPAHPVRVLDVGCGQGTQALRLAEGGHEVTALDHSSAMLADLKEELASKPPHVRERVRIVLGEAEQVADLFSGQRFDVILCHGVLMYLDDAEATLKAMAHILAPGHGLLSLLVRNADHEALRSGLQGDWSGSSAAMGSTRYRNRLGVEARADRIGQLADQLAEIRLKVEDWYGVLVFAEFAAMEAPVPPPHEFTEIITCEERAGRTEPYRRIAALLHLMARPGAA